MTIDPTNESTNPESITDQDIPEKLAGDAGEAPRSSIPSGPQVVEDDDADVDKEV